MQDAGLTGLSEGPTNSGQKTPTAPDQVIGTAVGRSYTVRKAARSSSRIWNSVSHPYRTVPTHHPVVHVSHSL